MKKVLTVAGSDTSGGAGIQADLKTFEERGVYGMTALTTIVTMAPDNNWSHHIYNVPLDVVESQLKTVLEGVGPDAVKTGMLGPAETIELVANRLKGQERLVIDPVMVCKGTDELLQPEAAAAIRDLLVPISLVVTPNLFEASQLAGTPALRTVEDMKEAAARIHESGARYVLIKGGSKLEQASTAVDLLYDGQEFRLFEAPKISTTYTHGAGCTYSAAITAEIARGLTVPEAVAAAKAFITSAIGSGFPLNRFVGPTMHAAHRLNAQGATLK